MAEDYSTTSRTYTEADLAQRPIDLLIERDRARDDMAAAHRELDFIGVHRLDPEDQGKILSLTERLKVVIGWEELRRKEESSSPRLSDLWRKGGAQGGERVPPAIHGKMILYAMGGNSTGIIHMGTADAINNQVGCLPAVPWSDVVAYFHCSALTPPAI